MLYYYYYYYYNQHFKYHDTGECEAIWLIIKHDQDNELINILIQSAKDQTKTFQARKKSVNLVELS